jgi:hypothetical protein
VKRRAEDTEVEVLVKLGTLLALLFINAIAWSAAL